MSERTEAEVLLEAFNSFHGNRIADAVVAIARKVRELDAPGHAKAVEEAFSAGRTSGAFFPPKPPQPPKPKTADQFSPEAHAIYDALKAAGHLTGLVTCEIAAQAAHEFLSKPKVTAGELLMDAFPVHREHGLLEAGE